MPKCAKYNCIIKKDFSTCNFDISSGLCTRVSVFEVSSEVLPSVAIKFVPEIKPHDDDRTGIQRG